MFLILVNLNKKMNMKSTFHKFLAIILFFSFMAISCDNDDNPKLSFVSNEISIPDSCVVFWCDLMEGDSIIFSNYKHLPKLKNNCSNEINNIYIEVDIYGIKDTTEINRMYVIDDVIKEDSGHLSVKAHLGKFDILPQEELAFPIISIYTPKENCAFLITYTCHYIQTQHIHKKVLCGVVYHEGNKYQNLAPTNPEISFLNMARSYIDWQYPRYNSLIYKDMVIPYIEKYDLLKEKDIKIQSISELQ